MAVVGSPGMENEKTESPLDTPRLSSGSASPSAGKADSNGDAASDTSSSAHSGGDPSSDRRELDFFNQGLATRSEEYRLLFKLPSDEVLLQDFNCALQDSILLQGHMYLFMHHVCFYSNIFGFENKKIIALNEVTSVRKAKTAGIFPNAIEIVSAGKKSFFGSFLSRDEAYRLITEGWTQHNPDAKAFLDRQDSRSSSLAEEITNGLILPEAKEENDVNSSSLRKVETSNTIEEIIISKNPNTEIICENNESNSHVVSKDVFIWENEDIAAPNVAECFTLIAEAKFPVGVEEFFKFFISDDSANFLDDFHKICGDKEFQVSKWTKNEQSRLVRNVSFLHPIKIYLGAKFGSTKEVQNLRVYKDNHLVVETSQTIMDAPFGDYFSVEGRWDVQKDSTNEGNGCKLRVYLYVSFVKKTIFRGKIDQATKDECRDVFALWIKLAKEILAKKIASEPKAEANTTTNTNSSISTIITHEINMDTDKPETSRKNEKLKEKIIPIANGPQVAPELNSVESTENPTQLNLEKSSSISIILKEILGAFVSFTKTTRFPAIMIAFSIAFIILMQVSIIVLLTRSPNVYVVAEGKNFIGNTAGYAKETTEYLERRFTLLKEEMRLVESQMERMRSEFTWLQSHLENLEKFKNKL